MQPQAMILSQRLVQIMPLPLVAQGEFALPATSQDDDFDKTHLLWCPITLTSTPNEEQHQRHLGHLLSK
jgi:hypothetical protein